MANYAEALVLVWTGKTPGSASMLKIAQRKGMPIYQKIVQPKPPSKQYGARAKEYKPGLFKK